MKRFFIFLMITLFSLSSIKANAANYYGTANNNASELDGVFFRATIQDMDAQWDNSNYRFVLHTCWLPTDSNTSWIEVGFLDGEWIGDHTYYRGFYAAQYIMDQNGNIQQRNLKKISGPSTQVGTTHTFQIQRDGNNTWGVYIDYTLRQTWTSGTGSVGFSPHVGLESNNIVSTSSTWNERAFQIYKNGTWLNWSDAILSQSGNASVNWDDEPTSIFSSQN
ncbi:MAG: hypothetical protein N4A50_03815 [Vallitalea sp.]|jgi:hypothetical protein|nr:hypothetical protein [Vallitalea sp.]